MTINLTDYARTPAQRGWGPGWPSCGGVRRVGTAVVTADRSGVRLSVHKRIARLVDLLLDETERRGYLLSDGQCGAFNCRPIAGTDVSSLHAWALALDLNWRRNPYAHPRVTDFPPWLPLLWNRYGFAWGGNYNHNGTTGKADAMHLEFMGSPADADAMTALALVELGAHPPAAQPTAPTPPPPFDVSEEDAVIVPTQFSPDGHFRATAPAEHGRTSTIFERCWATLTITWGGVIEDAAITFLGEDGAVIQQVGGRVANNRRMGIEAPDGAVTVTFEGHAPTDNSGSPPQVTAAVLYLPKR